LRSNKGEIRKRRTREHVIADLSINHVERFVLRCGWTVQRTTHDYGIDLLMETFNEVGEPQNGRVLFQLKATDTLKKRDNGRTVAARLDGRDILAWRHEPMPVILVLYDAQADLAYWLHVQEYFVGPRRRPIGKVPATTTARLPGDQVLDESAIRRFAQFRDAVFARIKGVIVYE
jgi:hypothetical protein